MEQDSSYLVEKKVDYLVNMKVGKLENQLAEALSHIEKLKCEVDVLKNKIGRMETAPSGQTTLIAGEKEAKKEAPKQASPNGRTGGYSSDDVSVEKMFYFGNKC